MVIQEIRWVPARSTHGEKVGYDDDGKLLTDPVDASGAEFYFYGTSDTVDRCIRALQFLHCDVCQTTPDRTAIVGIVHLNSWWWTLGFSQDVGFVLIESWFADQSATEPDPVDEAACSITQEVRHYYDKYINAFDLYVETGDTRLFYFVREHLDD